MFFRKYLRKKSIKYRKCNKSSDVLNKPESEGFEKKRSPRGFSIVLTKPAIEAMVYYGNFPGMRRMMKS